jgi:hypothetical protein
MTEVKGKFIGILSDDKGTTKENKDWRRVTFSIEIGDRYPKPAIFDTNNEDLIKTLSNLRSDEVISVAFNINCREYNGKWYTNLTAWKITI